MNLAGTPDIQVSRQKAGDATEGSVRRILADLRDHTYPAIETIRIRVSSGFA
jgi:uncharacterized protein YwbE